MFSLIISMLAVTPLMAAPQAIVFDFGGVLTKTPNREILVRFICQSFGFSEEEFERINQEKRLFVKQGGTDEEFWIAYAKTEKIELPHNWTESFKSTMIEAICIHSEMYDLVDTLKDQKIPIALLSNIDERLARFIREFGLYQPFDPCLLSYEIGIEKPDPKVYELLLSTLNLPAQEVVFIDDLAENVEAAKTIGIDAILFESIDQLRNELTKRSVKH